MVPAAPSPDSFLQTSIVVKKKGFRKLAQQQAIRRIALASNQGISPDAEAVKSPWSGGAIADGRGNTPEDFRVDQYILFGSFLFGCLSNNHFTADPKLALMNSLLRRAMFVMEISFGHCTSHSV